MRLSTVIAAACSALALLLAAAAQARPELARHHGAAALPAARTSLLHPSSKGRSSTAPAAPHGIRVAPFASTPIVKAYHVSGSPTVSSAMPYIDPNECEDNGTSCTDAQLCLYWAESCGSSPYGVPPANASQVEETE